MDRYFEQVQNEAGFTSACIESWFDACYGGDEKEKVGRAIDFFQRKPFVLEEERRLGVYSLFLDAAPEAPHWLMWRCELNEQLAAERPDRRYLELALADCEKRIELSEEDESTRIELLVALKQFDEALEALARIDEECWDERVEAYLGTGSFDAAIDLLTEQVEAASHDLDLQSLACARRGRAYNLAGDTVRRDEDWAYVRAVAAKKPQGNWLEHIFFTHLRSKNYKYLLDVLGNLDSRSTPISPGEVLNYRSVALAEWAKDDFDVEMANQSTACLYEAVNVEPGYIKGWTKLCRTLERQWRYTDAVELARNRPNRDVVDDIKDGRLIISFSLHKYLDSRLPYWHGREAAIRGLYDEAMEHYQHASGQESLWMEQAMTAGRLGDYQQMDDWLTKLLYRG